MNIKTIRFILFDQLNNKISSLEDIDAQHDLIFIPELYEDFTYVKHHKKKLVFMLSALRHFVEALSETGFNVEHIKLDAENKLNNLSDAINYLIKRYAPEQIILCEPSEYRISTVLNQIKKNHPGLIVVRHDNRFFCTLAEFQAWASDRKQLRMEFFYRGLREKYNILFKDGQPEGGQWNYDAENRRPLPKNYSVYNPFKAKIDPLTQEVLSYIAESFPDNFGDIEPFYLAVTRQDALQALDYFISKKLPYFGDYQDAMVEDDPWLYHSHISFYLNNGLLLPVECVALAEEHYYQGKAPLNAVEGFIRQILGWREYVRGVYWLMMPGYRELNYLNATRKLPDFYWTADTKMNCLKQCITNTQQNAYAHHIQRLMVLGNFLLLTGVHPDWVNEWYLIVYADAYEWVEMPNVTGMILFADGGYLGSKPYAASGAYIDKMSDYCKGCSYQVNVKTGEIACPFNYLYWNFLIHNAKILHKNPRLSMIYKTLSNMDEDRIKQIKADSARFLAELF